LMFLHTCGTLMIPPQKNDTYNFLPKRKQVSTLRLFIPHLTCTKSSPRQREKQHRRVLAVAMVEGTQSTDDFNIVSGQWRK
jgi:hypothetical protein